MLILSLCLFHDTPTTSEHLLITLRNVIIPQLFTVAVRSKARIVFARNNSAIMGSRRTTEMYERLRCPI
jgi:hypothetical protein